MSTVLAEGALYRLMTWLSPAYPTGAYTYSHGLEYAVETGAVRDRATLVAWIGAVLGQGAGRSDGALFAACWRAVLADDTAGLAGLVARAAAWRGSAEMALESSAQGAAFLAITARAWPHPVLEALAAMGEPPVALPIAVAAACAAHRLPLAPAVAAYLHALAGNLVSAGVRLVPLGQSDGQLAMAALEPAVARAAGDALAASLDTVGTAAPFIDWCSMQHETQYTRLFRS